MSLLATLLTVGCMCTPGYYGGMRPYAYPPGGMGCSSGCGTSCDTACDSCGVADDDCGVIEYGGNCCAPPRIANCRHSLANIGNGICLVGRGLLDVAAAPFVVVGGVLSSGCQYEVITHCPEVSYGACYPAQDMGTPCAPACSSGCDTCNEGYTEGIQYNTEAQSRPVTYQPRRNSIIQAAYQEPVPAVKFVKPR